MMVQECLHILMERVIMENGNKGLNVVQEHLKWKMVTFMLENLKMTKWKVKENILMQIKMFMKEPLEKERKMVVEL